MIEITPRLKTALADRYRIERPLGEGGMATVYLAEDLKHRRKVAVKVLKPELAAILGAERFLKEIEVTANLQHANILALYDSGEADTFLYYVMPFIEGESLRDRLDREKQLGVDEAVEVVKGVASALHYAHEHGIVHRDIKPENIMLQSGQPLVADFGIALALSAAGGTRLTETGLSLGTPHYMSPEQAMGDRELDARSDVYSLGAMVYEMLVGDPPHTGSTMQAIVARIITEEPSPISRTRQTVGAHIEAAVHKALAKVPADRFSSAAEFADAITNPAFALAKRDAAAPKTATPAAWGRQTLAFASLAAVLAVVLTGMVISSRLEQSSDLGVARFRVGVAASDVLDILGLPGLAFAPDGKRFAYGGPSEGQPQWQLWLHNLEQLDATPIRGSETGCCPTFSPDGQSIAFMTQSAVLRILSLGGGPARTVADSGFPDLVLYGGGVDWGPDGYLYASGLDGLVRVSPEGGPLEPMATLNRGRGDRTYAWPDVLPNANGALVTVIPQDVSDLAAYGIGVVDFAAGSVDILLQGIYARYAISGHVIFLQDDGTLLAAPFNENRLAVTGPAEPLLAGLHTAQLGATELAVSETGSLLYATGTAPVERVVWVDRDGTEEDIDPDWTGEFLNPVLSPDGSRVAVSLTTEGQNIWIKPLDGGEASRLTFAGALNYRTSWTPDGRSLMFVSDRTNAPALYQKAADGGGGAALVPVYDPRPVSAGEWSGDSQWLVFRTDNQTPGQGDILALRTAADTVPQLVVATPAEELSPALSPDGRWLVYVSDKSGRREVYVQPFPNAANTMWQISTTGGIEPLWSHSGRELFYRDLDQNLIAVQVVYDPAFSPGSQRVLFSVANYSTHPFHRNYDITADDQRFVMIRQDQPDRQGNLILALNFFEELKAKVEN
jgi:serine/threonine-protein kinase